MSRGELYASKWCRRTKDNRLKKEERERREDLTRVGTLIYNEKGVPASTIRQLELIPAKGRE